MFLHSCKKNAFPLEWKDTNMQNHFILWSKWHIYIAFYMPQQREKTHNLYMSQFVAGQRTQQQKWGLGGHEPHQSATKQPRTSIISNQSLNSSITVHVWWSLRKPKKKKGLLWTALGLSSIPMCVQQQFSSSSHISVFTFSVKASFAWNQWKTSKCTLSSSRTI